jgi:hypothetical protein
MLAEVNGHYDLPSMDVPNRETATQNWRFAKFVAMGGVK